MTQHVPITDEIEDQKKRGVLLVLTGPSGSGKDTLIGHLHDENPRIKKVITTTSRAMRDGEKEGFPYHFINREQFEQLIAEEAFFEWVEFRGELYGTQKKSLTEALEGGGDAIWKMEAKGIKNIKEKIKQTIPRSVFVYVTAPEVETLKTRVYKAEGEEKAHLRWNESLVVWEMKQYEDCEYLLVNNDGQLQNAVKQLQAIIEAKRREILPR